MAPKDDWQPKRPGPPPKPRTYEQKVQDDLREMHEADKREKEKLEQWRREADAREKALAARRQQLGPILNDRQSKCILALQGFQTDIGIRKNKWSNAAIDFADAYESAWNNFTGALNDSNAHSQLMWNLAFAALGACAMGGVNLLCVRLAGSGWQVEAGKELFVSVTTDMVQSGVGGLMNVLPGKLAEAYNSQMIPSPLRYKGALEKLINDFESDLLEWLKEQQKALKALDLLDFENYDPQKLDNAIQAFWEEKDRKFNPDSFERGADKAAFTAEVEKMMWVNWTTQLAKEILDREGPDPGRFSSHKYKKKLPEVAVKKMVKYNFVEDGSGVSDADRLTVADWGPVTASIMKGMIAKLTAYKPRKFG